MVQHQAKAIMQGWSETCVHDDPELAVPDGRTEGHRGPRHPAQQLLLSPRFPENLLLSMMTDERPSIRELALRRILKARDQPKRKGVRQFRVPPLNFDCTDYTAMIDWSTVSVTDPPITMSISDDDPREFIREPTTPVVTFNRYPCHTQAVERCIKVVTEASQSVCGENRRDGFIRTRLESRAKMPVFETKRDFNM